MCDLEPFSKIQSHIIKSLKHEAIQVYCISDPMTKYDATHLYH